MARQRLNSAIVRLPEGKSFGFIYDPEQSGRGDYFFHANDLESGRFEDLVVGDEVSFEVTESPKGPRAGHVNLLSQQPLVARAR